MECGMTNQSRMGLASHEEVMYRARSTTWAVAGRRQTNSIDAGRCCAPGGRVAASLGSGAEAIRRPCGLKALLRNNIHALPAVETAWHLTGRLKSQPSAG